MFRRLAGVAVVIGAALGFSSSPATQERGAPRFAIERVNGRDAVRGEVLVKFTRTLAAGEMTEIGSLTDAESVSRIGRTGVRRVRSRSLSAAALMARFAGRDDVAYVGPNYIVHAIAAPNDPSFTQLWGLKNTAQAVGGSAPGTSGADIHATDAWDVSTGSSDIVVGIIDTGIDYRHPDLAANMWSAPADFSVTIAGIPITCPAGSHGFNAITMTCNPMDDHYHGTHVAGTIGAAGDNGIGVAGVNWTTRMMGLKFLDATGSGTTADAINSIEFAIQAKQAFASTGGANVRVLSNSWGGYGEDSQALLDEINAANAAEMLFVAGAGNNGLPNDYLPFYPASFEAPNVVAVAATDNNDYLAWFSNWGAESVDLAAPGVDILSTVTGGGYAFLDGTSMATPHVSGAAALVLSRCAVSTGDLKDMLLSTATVLDSLAGLTATSGRVDVNSALHSCIAPPPAPFGLAAAGSNGKVTLTWPSVTGALRYAVKRSLTSGGPYAVLAPDVKGGTYVDTAVVNNTTYYYVISASNPAGESGDSNEASATPKIPADLVVSAMVVPASGAAGGTLTVSETTKNLAAGPSVATTTRYYLSSNTALDAGDTLLDGAHDVPALAAAATHTASVVLTLPIDAAAGMRYIIARADADALESESNENNNNLAKAVKIGPDLGVSVLAAPAKGPAGGSISVTDTTVNNGAGDAPASVTRFYLSVNTTYGAGDIVLGGSHSVPELAAGATDTATTTVTIPETVAPGDYYLLARADADDLLPEVSDTNNTKGRPLDIGPDLIVSVLTVPTKASAGADITISETTANQGGGAATATVTRFYLSSNSTWDAADRLLDGSHSILDLPADALSTASTTVGIPADVTAGSYYVLAKADADASVVEIVEANNTLAKAMIVGGDLVVSALTVPGRIGAGLDVTVTDTTTNAGVNAVAASSTRFYLSANTTWDAGDTPLGGSHAVPPLAAGAAHSATTTVSIPAGLASGTYYMIAKADADGAFSEGSESNNTLARTTQLGPDLVVSALTVPAKSGAGLDISVTDTVTNQGGGEAVASVLRFYLSTNTVLDANDVLMPGSRDVSELAPGTFSAGSTTVTIPAAALPANYYVIARADADGAIAETAENNNIMAKPIQVGPDLTVSALSVPSKAAIGAVITVTDTVTNAGGAAAGASTTHFYLSTNPTFDAADTHLAECRNVLELAAGAVNAGQISVTLPSGLTPKTYYLIAVADGAGMVKERVETNNALAKAISITAQ